MSEEELKSMRHSLAHIMAQAIQHLWPQAKFGVGPAIDNGFYYDIYLDNGTISEADLPKIEEEMRKIVAANYPFERRDVSVEEAIDWAIKGDQSFKVELLNDLKRSGTTVASELAGEKMGSVSDGDSKVETVSLYSQGDYTDLCRGGHVDSTGKVGAFKLTKTAGAYWRGNENNPQMQRIYGVAFATQEELDEYLNRLEIAKQRDHRKLGKELDLYTTSPLVGIGLPLFTPRGTILRDIVAQYSNQLRQKFGFEKVWTPHITKKDLYETSGHWAKFGEELFLVKSQETSDEMALKPMNCPHHTQIFASRPRSYRDMPVRYLETTTDYRDEKTGELGGLNRVRSLTQDDSHIFCRTDQIEGEINNLLAAARELYGSIDMKLRVRLSYRDESDSYLGDLSLWDSAQNQLKSAVEKVGLDYFEQEGEAAFYGPKIDFMATDAIGREHQVATVQLDFVQPQRFGLEYADADGNFTTPVMIHCALLGSIERFLSVFIEHTGGWFPFWAAPEQVRILTINDTVLEYVDKITTMLSDITLMEPVRYNDVRFTIDSRNESLGKKIREATSMKIPVQLIVGPKDMEANEVSIRTQSGEEKISLEQLAEYIKSL
ncbi:MULTISPECIES: threonine--tRNA ligase [unclassified Candidatus Nanosynbacter]|uniref:threonine--tRNA ligase n=1 Tax=unclassified Candidatus Nanosynbacter TaxID=2725944 RepID=UPI001FB7FA5C|nr:MULTISPECIES: threonine--tRNA ligase [unclassified Candidatus Nanosynbacter]MCJ1963036.1 threonine--tRNA ligase [Candidatus Nanosynbacter sp. TM7-033]UOG68234.1 threonine--tRNA ligase [Candidatus Nanosynbacter sp. HMT-352]